MPIARLTKIWLRHASLALALSASTTVSALAEQTCPLPEPEQLSRSESHSTTSPTPTLTTIEEGAIQVYADKFQYRDHTYDFTGNVVLLHGDYGLRTESLSFNSDAEQIALPESTYLQTPLLNLRTTRAFLDLEQSHARIDQLSFQVFGDSFRGSATEANADLKNQTLSLGRTYMTRCPGENPAWLFRATRLKIDMVKDVVRIYSPVLKLGPVPVFYFPYLSYPAHLGPASGFLTPVIRFSRRAGFLFNLPFYWRINDQHDMTFEPRWWTTSGFQYNHEYRFLSRYVKGTVNLSSLDSGAPEDSRNAYWGYDIKINAGAKDHNVDLYLQKVTDREYTLRYDTGLDLESFLYRRRIVYHYTGQDLQVRVNYAHWREVLHPDHRTSFSRIDTSEQSPRLEIDYEIPNLPQGLRFHLSTVLRRDELATRPNNEQAPDDARFLAQTYQGRALIEYSHLLGGGELSVGGALDYIRYEKTDLLADPEDDILHQLYWDWRWRWLQFGTSSLHRFSLRLRQFYNPEREQTVSPIFGSQLENWIPASIFSLNPYVGTDYLPRQQVSALIVEGNHYFGSDQGRLRWAWKVAGRFNNATTNSNSAPTSFVEIVDAAGEFEPVDFARLSDARWVFYHFQSLDAGRLGRLELEHAWAFEPNYHEWFARWHKSDGRNLYDIAYRRRAELIDHALVFSRLALAESWFLNLGFRYDFVSLRSSRAYIGATYSSCCMAVYFDIGKDLFDKFTFGFKIDLFGKKASARHFNWSLPEYLQQR